MTSLAPSEVARIRSRFAARSHSRTFWIAWWAAAVAGELLALRPFLTGPVDGIGVVFALVGGSFCAFGLIAWHRRPDSLGGALMTATGFLFFAAPVLGPLEAPLAFTVYVLVVDLWIFPFVALLLTFLTAGRLQPGFDRRLVASFALPVVVLQAAWLLTADLVDGTDLTGRNLLLVFPDTEFAHMIDRLQRGSLAFLGTVTVVVIVARWLRASGPRRRAMLPSLAGALRARLLRGAARERPDLRISLAAPPLVRRLLARRGPRRVPDRTPALAARARRPGGAGPRPRLRARRRARARAGPYPRRPGAARRVLAAGVRRLRGRRRAAGRAAGARRRPRRRIGPARRAPGRRARPRRLARRRPRAARGGDRRGGDRAGERAPARGVGGAARRPARVARADRQRRRRGAPAARARPARRRAAAARGDLAPASPAPEPARRRPVRGSSS